MSLEKSWNGPWRPAQFCQGLAPSQGTKGFPWTWAPSATGPASMTSHAGTRVLCHRSTTQDRITPCTPVPLPSHCHCGPQGPAVPQDLCALAVLSQRGDLHPKQEATGFGRRAAGSGIPRFAAGVTIPVTAPDPATPMRIEKPTGKWQDGAQPCHHRDESPCRAFVSPGATQKGTGSPAGPGGARWGAGARLTRREASPAASC